MDTHAEHLRAFCEELTDEKFRPFGISMMRYNAITQLISLLHFDSFRSVAAEPFSGECSVCLEAFTQRSELILTRCGHPFHPSCIVNSLHSVSCCPLCRTPVQDLIPPDFEGSVMHFLSFIQSDLHHVETCYCRFLAFAQHQIQALMIMTKFSNQSIGNVLGQAVDLERMLRVAVIFCRLNYDGFCKVLAQFDTLSPMPVAKPVLDTIHSTHFYIDCCAARPDHSAGRIGAMLAFLESSFDLRQRSPDIAKLGGLHRVLARDSLDDKGGGGALACVFVCRSNSARSIVAECVARARSAAVSFHGRRVDFFSAGTAPAPAVKAGIRAALERAGYSLAGLGPKRVGRLLETALRGRPACCFVTMAGDAAADLRWDPAITALAAREGRPAMLVDAAIAAPVRPGASPAEAAALYDGLVRDVEAMVAALPALLGGARPLFEPAGPAADGED